MIKSTTSSLVADTVEENTVNRTSTVSTSHDTQNMTYTDYGYRIPFVEAAAQNSRAQISLQSERFSQYMTFQSLPSLEAIFGNELTAIDMDVKRLQVAYLNTILLPPISGVVTGVYKRVGEAVIAGETVLRIEDNSTVHLAGILIHGGILSLGAGVTVQANLFSSSTSTSITGNIIAVRGDESGDDRWDVVISCPNTDGDGNPILPLNYNFDFDDTSVTIT